MAIADCGLDLEKLWAQLQEECKGCKDCERCLLLSSDKRDGRYNKNEAISCLNVKKAKLSKWVTILLCRFMYKEDVVYYLKESKNEDLFKAFYLNDMRMSNLNDLSEKEEAEPKLQCFFLLQQQRLKNKIQNLTTEMKRKGWFKTVKQKTKDNVKSTLQ